MSQLLVTSAPVIYIFLLLERKQQKWSLLKRADTVNGKTSCWVHCKLKHFVWGTGAPSHLQIPPWGYANEIESYDTAYGGNLGGLFWYVCLDKNLKGRSCVCFLPKLPWVHNKLPLTEAAPRKKASCYLEPKSSWFIRPGYFPETVFLSPWCPGERLLRAARPKDCSTGMLCALWTAHLSGGGRTWGNNCWGCLIQDRGLIPHWASDQIKSSMLAFSPLSPQTHFWPFSLWSVPKDADLWWWGFLAPWPTESCTGEASSQRWIGRGRQGFVSHAFPASVRCLSLRLSSSWVTTVPLCGSSSSAPLLTGSSDSDPPHRSAQRYWWLLTVARFWVPHHPCLVL